MRKGLSPERRDAIVGKSLSVTEVVEQVDGFATVDEVEAARVGQRLLGCRSEGGSWRYPAFQFVDGRVVGGLSETLSAVFSVLDSWEAAVWFCTPNPRLDYWTPAAVLQVGGDAHVVAGFARTEMRELMALQAGE